MWQVLSPRAMEFCPWLQWSGHGHGQDGPRQTEGDGLTWWFLWLEVLSNGDAGSLCTGPFGWVMLVGLGMHVVAGYKQGKGRIGGAAQHSRWRKDALLIS